MAWDEENVSRVPRACVPRALQPCPRQTRASRGEAEEVMPGLAGLDVHLYSLLFKIKIPFMVIFYISASKNKERFPHLTFKSRSQNCSWIRSCAY